MRNLGMVIVNYNDYDMTKRLINNVKNYNVIDKIVIVDNCSTDDSYVKLKQLENDKIAIIKNNENKGYASGLNYGSKYLINLLDNPIIIFSNTDIVIRDEDDLVKLKNDISEDIKVVGPTINEHGILNRGWKMTNPRIEILSNLPLIHKYFKRKYLYYTNDYYVNDLSYVDVVSGCFFLVDSIILKDINYFDENTFLYYEEFILASKIKKNNKQIVVDNKVSIIHDHSVTVDKSINRIKKYKILKSSQQYFVENYLKANILERLLLFLTSKLSLGILYIRCLFDR